MLFHLFRIFLVKREPDFFRDDDISRSEFIRKIFSKQINFSYQKRDMKFVFVSNEADIIYGRIGSEETLNANEGPDQKFEPARFNIWKASDIYIETKEHKDGQKIMINIAGGKRNNLRLLKEMAKNINSNIDHQYTLEINQIVQKSDFWSAAKDYRGKITSLEFEFVTPNIWGSRSELDNDLKKLQSDNKAERIITKMENSEGKLDVFKQNVEDAVRYATDGGGHAKIKSFKKKVYDSRNPNNAIEISFDTVDPSVTEIAKEFQTMAPINDLTQSEISISEDTREASSSKTESTRRVVGNEDDDGGVLA